MIIDPVTLTLPRHVVEVLQSITEARLKQIAPGGINHRRTEDALDYLTDALVAADRKTAEQADFKVFWAANPHLLLGEARALFAGKKLAFLKDEKLPLRRGDRIKMFNRHITLTFAYTTDTGQIATQEGEDVLVFDVDDFADVVMVGRPASHIDRHQTA